MEARDSGTQQGWNAGAVVNHYERSVPWTHTVTIHDLNNRYKLINLSGLS